MKIDVFESGDSQKKGFVALHGCRLQIVVMLMLSGRNSSTASRVELRESHLPSGQGLDAAFSKVSVFDFGPWWMFRQQ